MPLSEIICTLIFAIPMHDLSIVLINPRSTAVDVVDQRICGMTPGPRLCWQNFHVYSDRRAYVMSMESIQK